MVIGVDYTEQIRRLRELRAHFESCHVCGLQGFGLSTDDICFQCEKNRLMNEEGLSEEDATEVARLECLNSGSQGRLGEQWFAQLQRRKKSLGIA